MHIRPLLLLVIAFWISAAAAQESPGDEAVRLLSEYLRVDTTNPPGNEIRGAEFFKRIFEREGIEAQIFESAPGRGNVYARLKGDGSKKALLLLNHMDVVPVDRRYWTVDPFGGEIKDGFIWGRGAIDMKSTAILELMAMLTLKRTGAPLKSDIVFLGTADEEAGGAMGAGYMTREHFDLIADAGVVLNEFGTIAVSDEGKLRFYGASAAEKTPFWLKLTARGTAGHGSAPRPDSAVVRLIAALNRVAQFQTELQVVPVIQQFYADTAELEAAPENRERYKDLRSALKDPTFAAEFIKERSRNASVRNTISITMLEGSNKVNVIPAEASAQLDIRLLPSQDPAQFLQRLRTVIGDDAIQIDTVLSFPPSASPTSGEFFSALRKIAQRFDPGAKVTSPMLNGFTDCHFFREKGIPCYGFATLRTTTKDLIGVHGNDERVGVENVRTATEVMIELVRELAR